MIEQTPLTAAEVASGRVLRVGVGFSSHPDTIWAAVRATAMARTGLHGATPDLVLLVTAGVPTQDAVPMIRGALGAVGVAGGSTTAILTHNGAVGAGALVVCLANSEGAVSGVAAAPGRNLAEASQGIARLILAGWPFRMRYPRGLGLAFVRPGLGAPAEQFLPPCPPRRWSTAQRPRTPPRAPPASRRTTRRASATPKASRRARRSLIATRSSRGRSTRRPPRSSASRGTPRGSCSSSSRARATGPSAPPRARRGRRSATGGIRGRP